MYCVYEGRVSRVRLVFARRFVLLLPSVATRVLGFSLSGHCRISLPSACPRWNLPPCPEALRVRLDFGAMLAC